MANKQPEVTAATRKRIVDAFWELYENRPLAQIAIKEVAARAGVHRVTFYEYFSNLEDLLDREEQTIIDAILVHAPNTASNPQAALGTVRAVYSDHGDKICALMGPLGDPSFVHRFKKALLPAFEEARSLSDAPETALAFEFGINGLLAAFCWWHEHQDDLPLDSFISIMRGIVEKGVLTGATRG